MAEHIPAHDNGERPIVAAGNDTVPLVYFDRVTLRRGESRTFALEGHESCVVPVTGRCTVEVDTERFAGIGTREHLFEGVPNGVYVPLGAECTIVAESDTLEAFVAGGRLEEKLAPFAVRDEDVDIVQYGSDDTKTHRKIKHVLGQGNAGRRGRLLVSELFTVGQGGWSGFPPHKHDTDRDGDDGRPIETRIEEVYQFRFDPPEGFACQFDYLEDGGGGRGLAGRPHHIRHGDTYLIDAGYHPCVVAPGYRMYYFTIIVGETSQSLVQFFEPTHAHQIETIPGMVSIWWAWVGSKNCTRLFEVSPTMIVK